MPALIFIVNLVQKCRMDFTLDRGAELTYRVLLAFFPFVIFLMAAVGFFELDEAAFMQHVPNIFPEDVADLIQSFVADLGVSQSRGLLSTGLFFAVYNTTNGFRAVIRCVNRAYGVIDPRNFAYRVLLSFVLMLMFTFSLLFMVGVLVFGAEIWHFFFPEAPMMLFNLVRIIGGLAVLTFVTTLIYRLSIAQKMRLREILPGAALTVTAWVVASTIFGFVIIRFTQYPAIYGSIAGVFILVLWLNLICIILLIGNEFNAGLKMVADGRKIR